MDAWKAGDKCFFLSPEAFGRQYKQLQERSMAAYLPVFENEGGTVKSLIGDAEVVTGAGDRFRAIAQKHRAWENPFKLMKLFLRQCSNYNVEEIRNKEGRSMGENKSHLGDFEELIMLAVLRLRDNAYGVAIRQALQNATGRNVSIGAVYTTLDRLEEKGFVSSHAGEATAERGGRAKRYFKIEAAGFQALDETEWNRRRLREGLTLETGQVGA